MKQSAGEITKERILRAALKTWPDIRLATIAKTTGLTHPNILYHYPADTLKYAVAEYAVKQGHSAIIVQLIGMAHPTVKHLTAAERIRHFKSI